MNEGKMIILQMLGDGKITPEEAVKLLEALPKSDHESEQKTRLTNKTIEEIGSDIGNAFSNLFTSLKDIGSSININNLTETIDLDLEEDIKDLINPIINIKSVNGYIKLGKHELDSMKIHIRCNYKEGAFTPDQQFYKFYMDKNRIVFYPIYNNDVSINIDVMIPSKVYETITLETTNGPIEIDGIDVNNITCETKNSSIKLSAYTSKGSIKN